MQVLETSGLEALGTAFCVSGRPRLDRPALDIKIRTPDEIVQRRIDGGHLWVYPLPVGDEAEVEVRVLGGGSIGGKKRIRLKLEGGAAGLVFDARGRPLPLEEDVARRAAQMMQWLAEATGSMMHDLAVCGPVAPQASWAAVDAGRRRLRRIDQPDPQAEADLDDLLGMEYQEDDDTQREVDDIRNALS